VQRKVVETLGFISSEKKRFSIRKCCRAEKLKRGASGRWLTVDVGRRYGGGKKKAMTLRWRRSAEEEKLRLIRVRHRAAGDQKP